jgi:GT2 family glycosyltransferase
MFMLDDLPLIGKYLPSTQHTGRRAQPPHTTTNLRPQLQDWVAATAVLIRSEVIKEVGVLDENIFMYGEDVEYCLRARHHQWDAAIDPEAKIIHLGSASSTSQNAILGELKGWVYIWSKHFPLWQVPLARLAIRVGCMLRVLLFGTITKQSQRADIYRRALQEIPLYDR